MVVDLEVFLCLDGISIDDPRLLHAIAGAFVSTYKRLRSLLQDVDGRVSH
jgi:hypothetical protein